MTGTVQFPCDRGVPGTLSRGWHHFEAGMYGKVVCRYCGRPPVNPEPAVRPTRQEECVHRWTYDGNEQFCDECGRTA